MALEIDEGKGDWLWLISLDKHTKTKVRQPCILFDPIATHFHNLSIVLPEKTRSGLLLNNAPCTEKERTRLTLEMITKVTVVRIGEFTGTADKGFGIRHHDSFIWAALVLCSLSSFEELLFYQLLVYLHSSIKGAPDAAHLCDWPEEGALELVEVVVELVAALGEARGGGVDGQLDLTEDAAIEAYVHQDIVGATLQPILDPHDLELLGLLPTDPVDLLVYPYDLALPRGAFAPEQIAHLEGEQAGRRRPGDGI